MRCRYCGNPVELGGSQWFHTDGPMWCRNVGKNVEEYVIDGTKAEPLTETDVVRSILDKYDKADTH